MAPGIISAYFDYDGVLYVRTPGNMMTPVPFGYLVSEKDGYALIEEDSVGSPGDHPEQGTPA